MVPLTIPSEALVSANGKKCFRNDDLSSARKAGRFDSKQDVFCRLDNFEDIYDDVYQILWESGIVK
jgi:hypothetical protein